MKNTENYTNDVVLTKLLSATAYNLYNKELGKQISPYAAIIISEFSSKQDFYREQGLLDEDGMFYYTGDKLESELNITRKEATPVIKNLVSLGLISTCVKGCPARSFYRVNSSAIVKFLEEKIINVTLKKRETSIEKIEKPVLTKSKNCDEKDTVSVLTKSKNWFCQKGEQVNKNINKEFNIKENKIKKHKGKFLENSDFSEIEKNTIKNSGKRFSEGLTNYMKSIIEIYNAALNKNEILENQNPTFSTNCKKLYQNKVALYDFKLYLSEKMSVKKYRKRLTPLFVTKPEHIIKELRHTTDLTEEEIISAAERLKSEAKYEKEKLKYENAKKQKNGHLKNE